MLCNTFIHLPGVGAHRERTLWERGILDWDRFLDAAGDGLLGAAICEAAIPLLHRSREAMDGGDVGFFQTLLPRRELWRMYSHFAEHALFLDIETTGLSPHYNEVTVVGALGQGKLALFISGINLDQFPAYVEQFPLLVTFNGSQFDVPFLRVHFPEARLDQAHLDLRFALASLGYRGGLKAIEHKLGLRRDPRIQGVDGFEAVRLWHRYRRGDHEALERLVLYNLTDVANLVELAQIAVELKQQHLGFPGEIAAREPLSAPTLDLGFLQSWIVQGNV